MLDQNIKDYIETNITFHPSIAGRARLAAGPITVEVLVVTDYKLSKQFAGDFPRLVEYIAIFFRSVNLRFAQIDKPRIIFRVRPRNSSLCRCRLSCTLTKITGQNLLFVMP